ncbi:MULTISPECIES: AraC family transcriptional regulator [unclassified Bradyrhizobium]|uniref:AraC family transcriptional regulator n=1 Tax=unclassified Bradyrhizobium TaxID=2631580 RepID=UPI0028EE7B7D|nr:MULTISPECIES: AraC family transcriptional regulator [unclassified Bradyrhizobium]
MRNVSLTQRRSEIAEGKYGVSEMTSVTEAKIAARWGMPPAAFLEPLPKSGISLARWRRTEAGSPFSQKAPRANHYLLSLVLKPMKARSFVDRRQIWAGPIPANSVRIVDPDCEREWSTDDGFDLLHCMIPRTAIAEMIDSEERIRFVDPLYSRDDRILQIGNQLLWAMQQDGRFGVEFANGLTHALLAYLLQQYTRNSLPHSASGLRPAQLRRVMDLIASRIASGVSLHEMAREAGMSPFHFSRQFRSSTGLSPARYALVKRIEWAKEQLLDRRADILEVALDCGFKDPSHFSRSFKSVVGQSPRDYRRLN